MTQPTYLDGEPTNLEAAALDALGWLQFWREYLNHNCLNQDWNESRRRMTQAIRALDHFLPDKEQIHHATKKPPAYGAVAFIPGPADVP